MEIHEKWFQNGLMFIVRIRLNTPLAEPGWLLPSLAFEGTPTVLSGSFEIGVTPSVCAQMKTSNLKMSIMDDVGETKAPTRFGAEGETTPEALRQKDLIVKTLWREAVKGPPKGNRATRAR